MFEVDVSNNTDVTLSLNLSPAKYWIILLYHVLITLLSLIGNFLVLYGTHRYNAINIDAVSLIFIKYLAVTDVSIALTSCVPTLITLITKQWVLGEGMCLVLAYLIYIPGIAQAFIIVEFTLYKLILLMSPMASLASEWSAGKMSATFGVTYLLTTAHTVCSLLIARGATYHPAELTCSINKERPEFTIYGGISVIMISFVPSILIIIINIALLMIAGRSQKNCLPNLPSLRAIVITLSISTIYVISTVPKGVMNVIVAQHKVPPTWLMLFQKEVYFLNTVCNPIVYTAVNTRFRGFVMRRMKRKINHVTINIADQIDSARMIRKSRTKTAESLMQMKKDWADGNDSEFETPC